MQEVRRSDGELCGYVSQLEGRWLGLSVFGATLAELPTEDDVRRHVEHCGLVALADRWTLIDVASGEEQVVCIQQTSPVEVTVALDYYSLPGVPTMTISVPDLRRRWRLEHRH